jgi:predicted lipoprotein with Yx(FWY)xxD motif
MEYRKRFVKLVTPMRVIGLIAILVLALSACAPASGAQSSSNQPAAGGYGSGNAGGATAAPTATSAAIPVTGGEATIAVAQDPKLGSILVDAKGMTLYAFTKDGPNQSNCTGKCLQNWPIVKTQGHPNAGSGVDASMIGSAALADGSMVVTYNKMPLYTFYKDTKAGDTNGQGVGSVWFTVSPDGKLVGQNAAPASNGTPTVASNPAAASEAVINVANDPKLGKILVGANGMTLYMFAKDTPDKSNCSAGCLKSWPPLVTLGSPKLGDGVDASLVGSTSLADGSKIVTYNHMPLYYFVKDTKPGDTIGQGNGNVWYVVSPDGKPVGMESGSATSVAPSSGSQVVINLATTKLGKILVDGKGMTLYIFTNDQPDKSNCSGQCLQNWPPLVTSGKPTVGYGVDASMVGTATLADGRTIVTYNHMPLYYFAKDAKQGDTNGQGVGSVWFVIGPDGSAMQ